MKKRKKLSSGSTAQSRTQKHVDQQAKFLRESIDVFEEDRAEPITAWMNSSGMIVIDDGDDIDLTNLGAGI